MRFFVSAITAIEMTSRRDKGTIFPAVSYFIVYLPSDECNEDILFNVDSMAHVLFNVVKNHKEFIKEMAAVSNGNGIQRQLNDLGRPSIPPRTSTRIVVVEAQFGPAIHAAR